MRAVFSDPSSSSVVAHSLRSGVFSFTRVCQGAQCVCATSQAPVQLLMVDMTFGKHQKQKQPKWCACFEHCVSDLSLAVGCDSGGLLSGYRDAVRLICALLYSSFLYPFNRTTVLLLCFFFSPSPLFSVILPSSALFLFTNAILCYNKQLYLYPCSLATLLWVALVVRRAPLGFFFRLSPP